MVRDIERVPNPRCLDTIGPAGTTINPRRPIICVALALETNQPERSSSFQHYHPSRQPTYHQQHGTSTGAQRGVDV